MKYLSILFALLVTSAVSAQTVETRLTILPGYQTAEGTRMAALRLDLPPGWKTYWRAPGDAGIPPLITVEGAPGARIHWPTPRAFDQNGMRSIGYAERLTLPVELPAGTTRLSGTMDIGICHDVCVPVELPFAADLGAPGPPDPAILGALLDQPQPRGTAVCEVASDTDGLRLTATLQTPSTGAPEALVIETADPAIWVSEPQIDRTGDRLVATARLKRGADAFALDRSGLRFTLLGRDRATEIIGCTGT
ncbi:hypothetical protein EU805_14140 [Salipiger sp. IMCC34102]|uniref:protein-disulfide reductase DsbD domain-containing protein n=1 Tax=Salipiger sp. IMCC34102 TaxID=2510647 RepID=UPI00101C2E25|nr:protein-disulfide reductase DsbD domain-containing protein [Salipiger sp. IMCC34102]RYH01393.1 hypothetical protein EU805_14140 [Salipiger sp. IMCC34102]